MMREVNPDKFKAVAVLNVGDKVKLTNGDIAEFQRIKQKKFIGVINGKRYDIPVNMFVEVIEKAPVNAYVPPIQNKAVFIPAKASINGISLKNMKQWNGIDWGGYEADVYMDGVKIGHIRNDGDGGESDIHIEKTARETFDQRMASYFEANPSEYPTEDIFLEELFNHSDNEKAFKRNMAKGFNIFALLWMAPRQQTLIDDRYSNSPTQIFCKSEQALQSEITTQGFKDSQVYRSLDEFVINTMGNKSQPENKKVPEQKIVHDGKNLAEKYFGRK